MAEADSHMLDIGKHCTEPSCHQLDFLPFSCGYCKQTFCSEHWKVESGHRCAQAVAADNRIDVPDCPLCGKPVPVDRDQDPNIPMDRHFTSGCAVLDPGNGLARPTGPKTKSPDLCAAPRCHTRLVAVRITCPTCRSDFCAAHRMPRDHACAPPKAGAAPGKTSLLTKKVSTKVAAPPVLAAKAASTPSSQPGLAALRRAKVAASERLHALGTTKEEAIDLDEEPDRATKPKPLSAAGRRDRQERANMVKSLEGRAAKGLLSDDQKLELAMLKAKNKREGSLPGVKNDCIIG